MTYHRGLTIVICNVAKKKVGVLHLDRSPVHHRAHTCMYTHPHSSLAHSPTARANVECLLILMCIFLDCRRKPENHTESPATA